MNKADNDASTRAVDSLINYEVLFHFYLLIIVETNPLKVHFMEPNEKGDRII